jgi:2'-5' RNA ligase
VQQLNSHNFEQVYKWLGVNLDTLGCVMLDLEPLENQLKGDSLYYSKNKDRFWIDGWVADKVPHITMLYGLLTEARNFQPHIEAVLNGWKMESVEIDDIGFFNSPYPDEPYYCIVAHIKQTDALLEGHHRLQFLPHVDTFAGYKPHMTICYIQKERGEEFRDQLISAFRNFWKGKQIRVVRLNFGGNKN